VIVVPDADHRAVTRAFVAAHAPPRLLALVAAALAPHVGANGDAVLARLMRSPRDEIERLHGGALDDLDPLTRVAARAVLDVALAPAPTADGLLERLRAHGERSGEADELTPVTALASLFGADAAPLVLVHPTDLRARDFLGRAAILVSELAGRAPSLPVALTGIATLDGTRESRGLALLREGAAHLTTLSREAITEHLPGSLRGAALSSAVARLADDGADDELAARFAAAAVETGDAARSAAERFLFARLESLPWSAGAFALNAHAEFDFGGRPAEIDLLAREHRIAIEIDGVHHFGDLDRYRRDRRKDVALQSCGYLVLRFLAEDVVARLEAILDTIRAAVELRRNR
jgi:hypothetical protein